MHTSVICNFLLLDPMLCTVYTDNLLEHLHKNKTSLIILMRTLTFPFVRINQRGYGYWLVCLNPAKGIIYEL